MAEKTWLEVQYKTSRSLAARIELHRTCSENPHDWHRWVFEFLQERLPADAKVFEVGGGKGDLWTRNAERIPESWKIFFSDSSVEMVEAARALHGSDPRFTFGVRNIEYPLPDSSRSLDAIVANHVLYHLEQIEVFLSEAARVVKPGGIVCASVTAADHLSTMYDLAGKFDLRLKALRTPGHREHVFGTSGLSIWKKYFSHVEWIDHPDAFIIDEMHIPLLVDYITSWSGGEAIVDKHGREKLIEFLGAELRRIGKLRFPKKEGLYLAQV